MGEQKGYVATCLKGDEGLLRRQVEVVDAEFVYVESLAWIDLLPISEFDPAWLHGRAFGPAGEVRWTRQSSDLILHVLTEDKARLPSGDGWLVGEYEADKPKEVLLWGRYDELLGPNYKRPPALQDRAVWAEVRIPRPLAYPLSPPPRPFERLPFVAAQSITYRRAEVPVLTRWAGLQHSDGRERREPCRGDE
jgi:hypothetical protein